MIVIIGLLAPLAIGAGWWLAQQGLFSKPWLEQGVIGPIPAPDRQSRAVPRTGLLLLLVIIGAMFSLLVSAWFMRRELGEWNPPPVPGLLWFNTGVLIAASAALEFALDAARHGRPQPMRHWVLGAGGLGLLFLLGQAWAWRILASEGYFAAGDAANGFFYLVTGLHALHIIGGIFALSRLSLRAAGNGSAQALQPSIELCAIYWLFMLVVWLVLFALLTGGASQFIALCVGLIYQGLPQ